MAAIFISKVNRYHLKNKGYSKVGMYGFPKGAELALLSASCFSQIDFVIATYLDFRLTKIRIQTTV